MQHHEILNKINNKTSSQCIKVYFRYVNNNFILLKGTTTNITIIHEVPYKNNFETNIANKIIKESISK